ncbi:MAG: methylisocitrate lyase [Nitrososphaeria archaeon]
MWFKNLQKDEFLIVPGVYDAFSALVAQKVGFKAVYLSGAALTSSMGLPDLGLITLDELAEAVRRIKRVVEIPIIVDADTGFGESLNVYRTVKVLEESGANAIQIEDQRNPKKCGHLEQKEVVSQEEMVEKLIAALDARKESLIIARTDARGVTGIDDTIARAKKYSEVGADIIFPEALLNEEEFRYVSKAVEAPLLANMTEFGKTPYITADSFKTMGYRMVIFPVTAFRGAARALMDIYSSLYKNGTQLPFLDRLMTRADQYQVINYGFYDDLDKKFYKKSQSIN